MKGISPLLAAIILIAITIAIATVVMGWVLTFTRTSQANIANKSTEQIDCTAASIGIEDVYIVNGTSGTARVILKNTGYTDNMRITGAVLYNTSGANFTLLPSSLPQDFDKGSIETLVFSSVSIPACPSGFSKVIITSGCGGIDAKFESTPKCV